MIQIQYGYIYDALAGKQSSNKKQAIHKAAQQKFAWTNYIVTTNKPTQFGE